MDVSDASYYIKPENNENKGSRMGHTKKKKKKKCSTFSQTFFKIFGKCNDLNVDFHFYAIIL